jgi:hypothetical protein
MAAWLGGMAEIAQEVRSWEASPKCATINGLVGVASLPSRAIEDRTGPHSEASGQPLPYIRVVRCVAAAIA